MSGPTAWGAMLRQALGMGVAPDTFWRLSVREWRLLLQPVAGAGAMGRAELERLSALWPDEGARR